MANRGFWKSAGNLFLPIGWLGGEIDEVKNSTRTIANSVKRLFVRDVPERSETFEEAMTRLGLSEEDVRHTIRNYSIYAMIFLLLGIALFAYAFYLLFAHFTITGWLIALAATGFCLVQFFRYDFWVFQMKQRRLGITFNEWKSHLLGGKGSST